MLYYTDASERRHAKICGSFQSTISFARPANATAYVANDVIGVADAVTPANAGSAIHHMIGCGPSNAVMTLRSAQLFHDVTAIPATQTTVKLWLFNASPTAILDNAATQLIPVADKLKFCCYVDLTTVEDLGDVLMNPAYNINKDVKLSTTGSLYVIIQTVGAFTPASGAIFRLQLNLKPLE